MKDLFESIIEQTKEAPYPRYIIMQKEAAEELFQKEFKHIPNDEAGMFKIHKNGKVLVKC